MGFFSYIKSLDSKFSWSFLGFVLAIASTGYAVYLAQFKSTSPELAFDILSCTQVLSVNENINNLDIFYKNQNLKQRKENLIVLTVRVANEGETGIREGDFFSKIPFGMSVIGGKIVDNPVLTSASNKFLKDEINLSYDSLNNIIISKIPIDKNQNFTIKVLTICPDRLLPTVVPLGKIAGIVNDITVRESYKQPANKELPLWKELTHGNFFAHILRFLAYLIILVTTAIVIIWPTTVISDALDARKRRKAVAMFMQQTSFVFPEYFQLVTNLYIENGLKELRRLFSIFDNNTLLNKYSVNATERKAPWIVRGRGDDFTGIHERSEVLRGRDMARIPPYDENDEPAKVINRLVGVGVIKKEEANYVVEPTFKNATKALVRFVYNK